MQIATEQITVLFNNSKKVADGAVAALDAIEYARRTALQAPFVDFQESVTAIRQITAAGLDYTRWLKTVQNTAAGTVSSLEDMDTRIRSVTHALTNIAAGATGIGLRSLRQAGINVREAGIEFDKSGKAIGSTEEILRKLQTYLDATFTGSLDKLNKTFPAILQNLSDLRAQLIEAFFTPVIKPFAQAASDFFDDLILRSPQAAREARLAAQGIDSVGQALANQQAVAAQATDLMERYGFSLEKATQIAQNFDEANGAEKLRAFFGVLGDYAGQGFSELAGAFEKGFQGLIGPNIQQQLFEGGANIILSFVDGILSAAIFVIQAVEEIASIVASFLVGFSPPKAGPLREIDSGGQNIIGAWSDGIERGGDQAEAAANSVAGRVSRALSRATGLGPNLLDLKGGSTDDLLSKVLPSSASLNSIRVAGQNAAADFLEGFRAGFDIGPLQGIVGSIKSLLEYGVATKQIAQESVGGYVDTLTALLYQAALQVQEFGSVTQDTINQIDSSFGVLAESVENILSLMSALASINNQISGAQDNIAGIQAQIEAYNDQIDAIERTVKEKERALKAAMKAYQDQIKAAQGVVDQRKAEVDLAQAAIDAIDKRVEAVQNQIKQFEISTSEIPDRFLRGRKREFDVTLLRLNQEKDLAQLQKDAADARVKAAQTEVDRIRELMQAEQDRRQLEIDALKERIEGIRDLINGEQKRLKEAQKYLQELQKQKQSIQELLKLEQQRLQAIQAQLNEAKKAASEKGAGVGTRGFFDPEIGAAATGLAQKFADLKKSVKDVFDNLNPAKLEEIRKKFEQLKGLVEGIPAGLAKFGDALGTGWDRFIDKFPIVKTIIDNFKTDFLGTALDIDSFKTTVEGTLKNIGIAWDDLYNNYLKPGFGILKEFWETTLPDALGKGEVAFKIVVGIIKEFFTITLPDILSKGKAAWDLFWLILSGKPAADLVDFLIAQFLRFVAWLALKLAEANDNWNNFWTNVNINATIAWNNFLLAAQNAWEDFAIRLNKWREDRTADFNKFADDVITSTKRWVDETRRRISDWAEDARRFFVTLFDDAIHKISKWAEELHTRIDEGITTIRRGFDDLSSTIQEKAGAIQAAWNNLFDSLTEKVRPFIQLVQKALDLYRDLSGTHAPSTSSGGGNGSQSGFTSDTSGDTTPANTNGDVLGQFQRGGVAHKTGKYLLHAGEVILNQGQQNRLMDRLVGAAASLQPSGPPIQITHVWEVVPDLNDRLDLENRMERATYEAINKVFPRGRTLVRR
jgi:predicted  nucleic acid-binding Zn-ribbon protein